MDALSTDSDSTSANSCLFPSVLVLQRSIPELNHRVTNSLVTNTFSLLLKGVTVVPKQKKNTSKSQASKSATAVKEGTRSSRIFSLLQWVVWGIYRKMGSVHKMQKSGQNMLVLVLIKKQWFRMWVLCLAACRNSSQDVSEQTGSMITNSKADLTSTVLPTMICYKLSGKTWPQITHFVTYSCRRHHDWITLVILLLLVSSLSNKMVTSVWTD